MTREFATGTISYGGFAFPAPFQATIHCRPDYDSTGRFVKYRTYTLTVNVTLCADDFGGGTQGTNISSSVEALRRLLCTPGLPLVITGQGFGDCNVSLSNTVGFGPKPTSCRLEPMGSFAAIHLVWEVTYTAVDCYIGTNISQVGEFSYEIAWGINELGLTTRTVSGSWEWLAVRNGDTIAVDADSWRGVHKFYVPQGFSRTQQNFRLSADRRTESFYITDTQLPSDNPYFPGMVKMDVRHRVSGLMARDVVFDNVISGSIEVAPGYDRRYALWAMYLIIRSRMNYSKMGKSGDSPSNKRTSGVVVCRNFDVEEDIFGRSMNFSFMYVLSCNKETLFTATGLFRKIQDGIELSVPDVLGNNSQLYRYDWDVWASSMENVWSPRGIANLHHTGAFATNDKIVMPCGTAPPSDDYESKIDRLNPKLPKEKPETMLFVKPSKDMSWLEFDPQLSVSESSPVVSSRPCRGSASDAKPTADYTGLSGSVNVGSSSENYPANVQPVVVQQCGPSEFVAFLDVRLTRVGWPIEEKDLPLVVTINGVPAKCVKTIQPKIKRPENSPSGPVYTRRYGKVYAVSGKPPFEIKMTDNVPKHLIPQGFDYTVIT